MRFSRWRSSAGIKSIFFSVCLHERKQSAFRPPFCFYFQILNWAGANNFVLSLPRLFIFFLIFSFSLQLQSPMQQEHAISKNLFFIFYLFIFTEAYINVLIHYYYSYTDLAPFICVCPFVREEEIFIIKKNIYILIKSSLISARVYWRLLRTGEIRERTLSFTWKHYHTEMNLLTTNMLARWRGSFARRPEGRPEADEGRPDRPDPGMTAPVIWHFKAYIIVPKCV